MALFIRSQVEPEMVPEINTPHDQYGPVNWIRAYTYAGAIPYGRSSLDKWGPDDFGYTDNDDHRVAILGA